MRQTSIDDLFAWRFEQLMLRLAAYGAIKAECRCNYGTWSCYYSCPTYGGELMLGTGLTPVYEEFPLR